LTDFAVFTSLAGFAVLAGAFALTIFCFITLPQQRSSDALA
jgi:hypothetical protein